ncbi:MAG: hypothetical protein ACYCUE_06845 [Steroidobacteraceae bacterium]
MNIGLQHRPFWERHGVEVLYAGAPVTVLEAKPGRLGIAVGDARNMIEVSSSMLRVRYHGKEYSWQEAVERFEPSVNRHGNRRFQRNGAENGRSAYLMQRKVAGSWITIGTVVYEEEDWVLRYSSSGRIERYETLAEAKDAALKI